jgi:hypothetical protein
MWQRGRSSRNHKRNEAAFRLRTKCGHASPGNVPDSYTLVSPAHTPATSPEYLWSMCYGFISV